ncbi:MAG TPA: hypothetical protein PKJ19_08110 [Flavobacteriales bacterium]|nr:hypothetical protein [Flavobacteriales bacterium]
MSKNREIRFRFWDHDDAYYMDRNEASENIQSTIDSLNNKLIIAQRDVRKMGDYVNLPWLIRIFTKAPKL